ncbi:MAG: tryptophan synthase subunit alpha [Actinomycetota bacterium]|nr:tryptophan synthase subunit alpha [Actinomycetota bacterium]
MSGAASIAAGFAAARQERRAALMPYMMGGFPDLQRSQAIAQAYADAGADLVELGVPYSDPLADGPVIHAAAGRALAAGARLSSVLDLGAALAAQVPVVVMCYFNLVLAQGLERFLDELRGRGISGVIVPDLPLEEAPEALAACDERDLALVPLVAPTTPPERLQRIGARARGFLYTVSVTGTTGERSTLGDGLGAILQSARASTEVPVAVGFGIGTPEQAREAAAAGADGVIVGTRLVRAAGEAEDPAAAVRALVGEFATALHGQPVG